MTTTYDVIVLGVGGFGASACYHAARRGAKVLGLEQFTPAHDRGSSHGETRIIRQAYFEHPDYVPLAVRAYELWDDLAREVNKPLFQRQGLLISGRTEGEVVDGTRGSARQHGLPLDEYAREDARRKFPAFEFPDDHVALFEANAGYLAVEDCTRSHIEMAQRHGADLRFESPVRSWQSDGKVVRVQTDQEEFTAQKLIITAGAWASRCLSELQIPLTVKRKFVGWFRVPPAKLAMARAMPCFCFELDSHFFYGFPSLDGQTLKMAEHFGGQPVDDPAQVDRSVTPVDVDLLTGFIRRCLPVVEPVLVRHAVCMYTMTPDQNFIIDRHPERENVFIGCGFSGHGYKFTSVLGDVLAELAITGKTDAPVGFLSIDRPALSAR